jgi:hypothetical protein
MTKLTVPLADLWFEPVDGASRLMAAISLPLQTTAFGIELAGGSLAFRHVADIKGRRVFAASEWHPADDPGLASRGPSWLLSGPFQRGPQNVA